MSVAGWAWALFLLLVSPAVGSFLGVLVDRLPRGRSVLTRSRCAACGTHLRPRDLVPVLSAIAQGHRCRYCGAEIPGHLTRIEVAAILAACLAVALVPDPLRMTLTLFVLWCLIALFYTDLLHFRLPDALTGALFALGLAMAATDPARGLAAGLIGAAAGALPFLALAWAYRALRGREGLGPGDVKLMAGIGAALGWAAVPWVALVAAGLGLAVEGLRALRTRRLPAATQQLPFGAYLCAAAALLALLPFALAMSIRI